MIKIKLISNGAILKTEDGEQAYIYEKDDIEGLRDMLFDLLDLVGESGGKYDKERISITIKHGHAYECKDKGCPICHTL